ncbi:DUF3732 domain-containing protein [Streptomyces laculatispora]|uniref:DUF3732 domain-containing protein n=1 Tax=Streptomyces laculatispora TaxID=887464 RepID=A0ABY9IAM2_9ACTN|nr:DUF3732 domain-containing protein [Streptomyces laculatispora]WLQ43938.1 DUF3732 domain-containing protein [Streptomyces laculatispora]
MQLLALILYNANGGRRLIHFRTGALNVVTGQSASGKSTLLGIFEYCTGRKSVTFPIGPMTDTVSWYAALFQLENTRAFVARPAPGPGKKTAAEQVMLKFGPDLEPLSYTDLAPNTDRHTLRQRLGRFIGIEENHSTTPRRRGPSAVGAHLGHAALLCLQGQNEIADNNHLFHRQSDRHVASALKETLPYFLGAAPHDQARKHAQLNAARSRLTQAEKDLAQAHDPNGIAHITLAGLWHEAHTLSLVPAPTAPDDYVQATQALQDAVLAPATEQAHALEEDQRKLDLERTCADLREQLRALATDRRLLLAETAAADDYATSAHIPRGRLASLDLVPHRLDDDASTCALCGSVLSQPDPTIDALRNSLDRLQHQIRGIDAMRPARRAALEELHQQATRLRSRLRAAETALQALTQADHTNGHLPRRDRIDFARGRIHGMLTALQHTTGADLARLSQARDTAKATVDALEAELDPRTAHEELLARLVPVNQDIALWAHQLQLEPRNQGVYLNPTQLTVEFGARTGRLPLSRVGSGRNWVGYHVLAHLALHRYFVRQRRPVPRILFLDQPSQVWFPPATHDGDDHTDKDSRAAQELFRLIHEVVKDLAPELQVIVCDHVDFPTPWFQEAVVHRWHHSEKLVPAHWADLTGSPQPLP